MNALQFGTKNGFSAQSVKKLQPNKDRENRKNVEKNRHNVRGEPVAFAKQCKLPGLNNIVI